MSGQTRGELEAYCYMVSRGGKPAASLALQDRYVETAVTIIEEHGLKHHMEVLAHGWVTVWVYKHAHILDVIKATPQAPETAFEHWVLGKLFGYSEDAIQEFMTSKSHLGKVGSVALGTRG